MKPYIRKNRAPLSGALVCALAATAAAVVLQFFKGDVLDSAILGEAGAALNSALLLIGFILLETGFYFAYERLSARFSVACLRDLKADLFESILRRSYVRFRELPQGEYLAKYTNEAEQVKSRCFNMLPMLWEVAAKAVLVSVALFLLDWRIALITIALVSTPLYVPKLIEKRLQRAQRESVAAAERNLAAVADWLAGFEVLKNFSVERRVLTRFHRTNAELAAARRTDEQLDALSRLITTLISYLSYFIIVAFSAYLVLAGDFSAGDFFIAVGMIDQLSYPMIALARITRMLVAIRPTCDGLRAFIAARDADEPEGAPMRREIRFDRVGFSYEPGKPVLKEFSLTIERGKRYLLKGPSGCGKTTAANLLLRYYAADSGSVAVDGVPIGQCGNPYGWITVVRQEATLFHDTLRNNLTMYRDLADSALIGMLERVGLGKFANREALDSVVADGGANFSGGEKKRICLARALLRDTEMLILDEPLANLDDETARRIEALLLSIPDKTLLVVSHQFSAENLARFDEVVDLAR